MKDDSIPICRSILSHWVYLDAEYLKVWLTMLSQARYKEEPKTVMYEKALCTLNYGEFIFGYKAWSSKTGISYQRLRTLMGRLIEDNMLTLKVTTYHYSVYAVVNYAKFNSQETLIPSRLGGYANSHITDTQQPSNNHPTTNEEGIKKEKKDKKVLKDIYTATQFKPPTIEEVEKYCLERNNNVDANKWHDFYLSKGWMVGKNKMKDWKAAVRTWEHKDNQGGQAKPKPKQQDVSNQWLEMRKAAKGND